MTNLHIDILDQIRIETAHRRVFLPARDGTEPRRYDSLNHAVRRYIEASAMTSFSPQPEANLRTLAASFISREIRNRLQGHGMTDVGSVYYDRHDYLAEKRQAMEVWAERLIRTSNFAGG